MNHSKSGALCVGAPNSAARFASEARHAKETLEYGLLLLSDEGQQILERYALTQGCDWKVIVSANGEADFLANQSKELFAFLAGILFEFDKN